MSMSRLSFAVLLAGATAMMAGCPEVGPTAGFNADIVAGVAPQNVQFQDTSAPGDEAIAAWAWDFGDGGVSTAQNPTHTYASPGTYTVSLTVTTEVGEDTAERQDYIDVADAQDLMALTRSFPDGALYSPGGTLDITVALDFTGAQVVTALGLSENLPAGWTFDAVVAGDTPDIISSKSTIEFSWVTIPAFPVSFTYRVNVPASATGDALVSGTGIFRLDGPQLSTAEVISSISQGTGEGEGEGEGSVEGEGEGSVEGEGEGSVEGEGEGSVEGEGEGSVEGEGEGSVEGEGEGTVEGEGEGEGEGSVEGETVVSLSRSFAGGYGFVGGSSVDVVITLDRVGPGPAASLSLTETPPTGWSYNGLVDGDLPDTSPTAKAEGDLEFAWSTAPEFPVTFTYRVDIPSACGVFVWTGMGNYRADDTDRATNDEESHLSCPFYTSLNITERGISAPGTYTPGETLDITVGMDTAGSDTVTALGLTETLPGDWVFEGIVSGDAPGVAPQVGETGVFEFAWITIPTFPMSFTYQVSVPAGAAGISRIYGQAQYRFDAAALDSNVEETFLPETP